MENIQEVQKIISESPRGFGGFKKKMEIQKAETEKVDMQEVLRRLYRIEKEIVELNRRSDSRMIEIIKRQDEQTELLKKIIDTVK